MLTRYCQPRLVQFWLAVGLLLGACQSPPQAWAPGKTFRTRGHKLIYRVEHFGTAATQPFLVDTIAITAYGTRQRFDPAARGADSIRQWNTEYGYSDFGSPIGSSVIENDTMLWLHPPRDGKYRILELSPFPYIKLPTRPGQRWPWSLNVGSQWADPKWAVWQGNIRITYTYQTIGPQALTTPFGSFTCWLVRGQTSCPVGTSTLDSYYHPQLGFVRLAYRTIDGRRLTMNLVATAQVALPNTSPATYLPKAWQLSTTP
jgi:hypothetical protein